MLLLHNPMWHIHRLSPAISAGMCSEWQNLPPCHQKQLAESRCNLSKYQKLILTTAETFFLPAFASSSTCCVLNCIIIIMNIVLEFYPCMPNIAGFIVGNLANFVIFRRTSLHVQQSGAPTTGTCCNFLISQQSVKIKSIISSQREVTPFWT